MTDPAPPKPAAPDRNRLKLETCTANAVASHNPGSVVTYKDNTDVERSNGGTFIAEQPTHLSDLVSAVKGNNPSQATRIEADVRHSAGQVYIRVSDDHVADGEGIINSGHHINSELVVAQTKYDRVDTKVPDNEEARTTADRVPNTSIAQAVAKDINSCMASSGDAKLKTPVKNYFPKP
jgi:hypothetical protein